MEFSLIHENKLKVILTASDMQMFGLDCADMDYQDPPTRTALLSILDQGRAQLRFHPYKSKIFIEVFPHEEGGCVLYFTGMHANRSGKGGIEPILFEFASTEDLIQGAVAMYQRYRQRIYRSSLTLLNKRYRLIVYPLDYADRLSIYFLSEYAEKVGEGELLRAHTQEHGETLIQDKALEVLHDLFT